MKKLRIFLSVLMGLAICHTAFGQRLVYNLNQGWQLSYDSELSNDAKIQNIDLPHIWNLDAMTANSNYNRGQVSYVKITNIPSEWNGKVVYLRFKGVSQSSSFFLNSKYVGSHSGGYTAFAYNITNSLSYTSANSFELRVSNAINLNQMPLVGDFNNYGGIYRDVEVIVVPKTHILIDEYATKGVYVSPSLNVDGSAEIGLKVKLCLNSGDKTTAIFSIKTKEGEVLQSKSKEYRLGHTEERTEEISFVIDNPHLWDGINDPYMYKMCVRLESENGSAKKTFDEIETSFGIRSIEVNESNQFLLNGKPYKIYGVSRIEDWPLIGNALRKYNEDIDFDIIKEMGANAVRLSYFPQNDYFISKCDEAGILVWSEIPFTGPNGLKYKGFVDSEIFKENGKRQLSELIMQQYNHPSLCFLGLYSELILRGDNPTNYVEELNNLAKRLNGNYFTIASSIQDGQINDITDLIGFNQSFGWKNGKIEDLSDWGGAVRKKFPSLKIALSAYGAGSSIYQHQETMEKPDPQGSFHPEEWQCELHEKSWKIIKSSDYFFGTFASTMFDYSVAHREDGPVKGMNDFGMVTADRLVKKDVFYFYKANWNKDDIFVHITGARNNKRYNSKQQIKVYSNEDKVSLYLNDEFISDVSNDGNGVFVWNDVNLQDGVNIVRAVGNTGVEEVINLEKTESAKILK